jgi:hypothetical protein
MQTAGHFGAALAKAARASKAEDVPLLVAGALKGRERWKDVARDVLKAAAETVDFSGGRNIHGVLSLVAAAKLTEHLPYEEGALPIAQAIHYIAGQPKWSKPPDWLVDDKHDNREELNLASAIAITYAREDPALVEEAVRAFVHQASHLGGNWGHALIFATMTYDAGKLFGWEYAAPLFAVGIENILPANRDEAAHGAVWGRFEKGHLDFTAISRAPPAWTGGEHLTDLRKTLRKPTFDEAAAAVGKALEEGVSPEVLCEALSLAGADKMLRTAYGMSAAHALTFAHAVRRAVEIQRDGCTIGAIAVAGAFMGQQLEVYDRRAEGARMGKARVPAPSPAEFGRLLREGPVGDAVEAAQAISQEGLTQNHDYVRATVRAAATDDLMLSLGINLKHTEAALDEDRLSRSQDRASLLMAVAKNVAASERGTSVRDRFQRVLEERVRAPQ